MSKEYPEVLWVNVSPSLKRFDRPLIQHLAQHSKIAYWEYQVQYDAASSIETAIVLLQDYLKHCSKPIHLIGHGLGGVVALTYARQFPDRVRSLSLLAVAPQPAITWHSHYYVQRHLLPCSQVQVLAQVARTLFGPAAPYPITPLIHALAKDIDCAPSPHSLYKVTTLPEGGVDVPLMICHSQTDSVISQPLMQRWLKWFKPGDTFWTCPTGHHFFHYSAPELVNQQLHKFWNQVHQRETRHHHLVCA
ncbi:alpha/beta hydrolase [Alkalinema sp. FACHB-956]|uniref:alpha/beta fold hydrolase n=1 Tax=Alkalinema sp. FACHB-956 TaxID=2692768 RepID=UPI001686876D|nr:alpha/beta hydrolase [Alkalinema sp. FACHB-956]MBD2327894.1 alpha/beta hydrolase [Alkalinema sp. FACHB-956]